MCTGTGPVEENHVLEEENRPGGGEPRVRGGEPAQWRSTIHVIDRRTTCMVGEKYKHGGGEVP
jgi:hypothetical protein